MALLVSYPDGLAAKQQSLTRPCEARAFPSIITRRSDETILARTSTRLNSPPRRQLRARKKCTFPDS